MNKKRNKRIIILFVIFFLVVIWWQFGFYSIQPIGAFPDGVTWFVKRSIGEPFFNSPDALSIKRTGSVSLLSRGLALAEAPKERIILKLPYWKFAYLRSTGGRVFEK